MDNSPSNSSSPLKLAIPIVALAAVVFGITLLSQYSPKTENDDTSGSSKGSDNSSKVDLRFGSSIQFSGFFEPSPEVHRASFWFENRNPAPVTIQLASQTIVQLASQTPTGTPSNNVARVAAIPAGLTDQLVMTAIFSGFPQGLVTALPLGVAGQAANFAPDRLIWQELDPRSTPRPECKVSGAPSANQFFSYQWGILELQFQVAGAAQPTQLESNFTLQDGSHESKTETMRVYYEGVAPFDVYPRFINLGEWKETSEPRTYEFFAFSSTRGPKRLGVDFIGDLDPPAVKVQMMENMGNPGPFVSVSQPVCATDEEIKKLINNVSQSYKKPKPIWVETAYRYNMTVTPKVGEERVDLGPLEREIVLTMPEMNLTRKLYLKGMVKGSVWLENDRTNIDLLSYRANDGIVQTVRLNTEQRDAELVLVPNECEPKFLQPKLTKLPPASDRGFYDLAVIVPKNCPAGIWNGVIVLEQKGSRPLRMRIPVRGEAAR